LVFAHQASENIDKTIDSFQFSSKLLIPKFPDSEIKTDYAAFLILKKEIQALITNFYSSEERNTDYAIQKIKLIKSAAETLIHGQEITIPFIEFSNMLTVALIIIKHCKKRKTPYILSLN
jgi:L-aspartate oxidase